MPSVMKLSHHRPMVPCWRGGVSWRLLVVMGLVFLRVAGGVSAGVGPLVPGWWELPGDDASLGSGGAGDVAGAGGGDLHGEVAAGVAGHRGACCAAVASVGRAVLLTVRVVVSRAAMARRFNRVPQFS